ncbi:MAG: Fic family protein [Christensenellales bacterium]|jgi:Fic family protein
MEELIARFMERYLPRKEIVHRLPVSVSINRFWPELEKERRRQSQELPLPDQGGKLFWFVLNGSIEKQCDAIAALARRDIAFSGTLFDALMEDAVLDEAVYSVAIEGAFTSRKQAADLIRQNRQPRNKSEQMVKNNYDALTYVLEHLEDAINEEMILAIAKIVTRGASEVQVMGYREGQVYVMGREGVVYTPPKADAVPQMMRSLTEFIQESELHPLLKACIAHFYFVYVHPFEDGNGRCARALSYMMLLQAGYDFFRYVSVSNIVAEERNKYYRAMRNVEDSDGDMTYFIDAYSDMLARTVIKMEDHLRYHVFAAQKLKALEEAGALNDRQLKGAKWLLEGGGASVTVEAWRKKYKVVTETARRDLLALCDAKVVERKTEGRKAVFHVLREP